MPVARGPSINARSAVLVGLTGVVVALLLGGGVLWLASSGGEIEVVLGDTDFDAGSAERISDEIAERGPIVFSDVAGGDRDLVLQHLGDDPEVGWWAFDARRPGQPRDCFFEWRPEREVFELTAAPGTGTECPDDVVDATGGDVRSYPVTVGDDGRVRVDINAEPADTGADGDGDDEGGGGS